MNNLYQLKTSNLYQLDPPTADAYLVWVVDDEWPGDEGARPEPPKPVVSKCGTCGGSGNETEDSASAVGIPGGQFPIGPCPVCTGGWVTRLGTIEWRCKGIQYSGTKTSKGCPVSWWDGQGCGDGCGLVLVVPIGDNG